MNLEICRKMYQIVQRNMEKNGEGKPMPVSERMFISMAEHEDPGEIDLAPVADLPPMDYVNALYYLFQNMPNDMVDHWRRLESSVSEEEFKRLVTNTFLNCENVKKYHIRVLNNPYEHKGSRRIPFIGRLKR